MYTVHRCLICEEVYLGADKPSHCPFCGAHAEYMISESEWKDPARPALSEKSKANLEQTLGFEISNASFYQCAANKAKAAGDSWHYSMWKRLSRIESEHASIACKLLGIAAPPLNNDPALCSTDYVTNIQEAMKRETNAFTHYAQFRDEAVEPRVKQVFSALVVIETDHLNLEKRLSGTK